VIQSGESGDFNFGRLQFENVSVCNCIVAYFYRHTHWFRVLRHPKLESSDSSDSPKSALSALLDSVVRVPVGWFVSYHRGKNG
jgi:hypothetical protein